MTKFVGLGFRDGVGGNGPHDGRIFRQGDCGTRYWAKSRLDSIENAGMLSSSLVCGWR